MVKVVQLKEVLMLETQADGEEELSTDDILDAVVASRRASPNLSYFAFTATPKTKTLELFCLMMRENLEKLRSRKANNTLTRNEDKR